MSYLKLLQAALKTKVRMTLLSAAALSMFGGEMTATEITVGSDQLQVELNKKPTGDVVYKLNADQKRDTSVTQKPNDAPSYSNPYNPEWDSAFAIMHGDTTSKITIKSNGVVPYKLTTANNSGLRILAIKTANPLTLENIVITGGNLKSNTDSLYYNVYGGGIYLTSDFSTSLTEIGYLGNNSGNNNNMDYSDWKWNNVSGQVNVTFNSITVSGNTATDNRTNHYHKTDYGYISNEECYEKRDDCNQSNKVNYDSGYAKGGGLYANGCISLTDNNSVFENNRVITSSTAMGGAIYIENSGRVNSAETKLEDGVGPPLTSGGYANFSQKCIFNNTKFIGNRVTAEGKHASNHATIKDYDERARGGAVMLYFYVNHGGTYNIGDSKGEYQFNGVEFTRNTAEAINDGEAYGGAVYIYSEADANKVGSAKSIYSFNNVTFSENKAIAHKNGVAGGGAVYIGHMREDNDDDKISIKFTNTNFYNNAAITGNTDNASRASGGAITTDSDITISADAGKTSTFSGNYYQIGEKKTPNSIFLIGDKITNYIYEDDDHTKEPQKVVEYFGGVKVFYDGGGTIIDNDGIGCMNDFPNFPDLDKYPKDGGIEIKMTGAGKVVFNGANTYRGATNVLSGILEVGKNGSITKTESVKIASDAKIINAGKIKTAGAVAIAGNLTFNLNDTHLSVAGKRGDNAALTAAKVEMNNNGTITVSGGNVGVYELIKTTATNTESVAVKKAIEANSGILYQYSVLNNSAGLYAIEKSLGEKTQFVENANHETPANEGIANAIFAMANNPTASANLKDVLGKLETLQNNAQTFSRGVSELNNSIAASASAQIGGNATQAANSALTQVFNAPTSSSVASAAVDKNDSAAAGGIPVTYGETGADKAYKYGGFVKAYGGFGAESSTNSATGYDFGGVGVLTGIDYAVAANLKLGALFGYSFNNSDLYRDFGAATDHVLRFGLYGQFKWDNLFVNTAPTLGIHLLETQRKFQTLGFETAKGQRTGFDFNWLNQVGYVFEVGGFLITPTYALALTYMHDPSYTETGLSGVAGGQQNLTIDAYNSWSLTQNLGVKLGRVFCVNEKLALLPEIWAGWEHEYLSANDVSMAFAVAPENSWRSPVARIAADRAVFGFGLTTLISNRYEIFGRYDQKLWDGGFNTNFTVGASVKF